MDRQVDPIDVGLTEDELRSLAVDIEDLVDWAASAGPSRARLREAARLEYIEQTRRHVGILEQVCELMRIEPRSGVDAAQPLGQAELGGTPVWE
jgi:hypothetical protein